MNILSRNLSKVSAVLIHIFTLYELYIEYIPVYFKWFPRYLNKELSSLDEQSKV